MTTRVSYIFPPKKPIIWGSKTRRGITIPVAKGEARSSTGLPHTVLHPAGLVRGSGHSRSFGGNWRTPRPRGKAGDEASPASQGTLPWAPCPQPQPALPPPPGRSPARARRPPTSAEEAIRLVTSVSSKLEPGSPRLSRRGRAKGFAASTVSICCAASVCVSLSCSLIRYEPTALVWLYSPRPGTCHGKR